MPNPTHVHWLRSYDVLTRWGETFCGFRGTYKIESKYLVFDAFANRGVDVFDATTAFCEVTCARCARYRLSHTKVQIQSQKAVMEGTPA